MVWQPTPAYGGQATAIITCANPDGLEQNFTTGWNNENDYFLDKGNIPQHYCEGGFAGQFTTFVGAVSSDGSELDPSLLYHPGYLPPATDGDQVNPEPEPIPAPETEQVVRTDDVERTEDVSRDVERTDEEATADVARTEEVVREPEPVATLAPTPITVEPAPVEPVIEPTPEPTLEPEPEPVPKSPVRPVQPTSPPEVITPTPEPVEPSTSPTEPQLPSEPASEPSLPEVEETQGIGLALEALSKLGDNLRSIGSDMTPEVREQAQQVIVASVIVTQIALSGRKP